MQFRPRIDGHIVENLYGCSSNNISANVLFLHGAIHLLEKNSRAYKVIRGGNHLNLSELRDFLINHYKTKELNNLLVFDATSYNKIKHIYKNIYLEKSYDKILSINSDIIVYGCNILDKNNDVDFGNDAHLWRRLVNSKTKNIYIGICCDDKDKLDNYAESVHKNLKLFRNIENETINYYCYPQRKINIWKSDNFLAEIINNRSKGYPIQSDK